MNNRRFSAGALALFVAASLAGALITGCKNAESQVVGDWKDASGRITTFKADKTLSQGTGAMAMAGKWSFADKKVTVSIETIGGKPADQVIDQLISAITKLNPKGAKPEDVAKAKKMMKELTFSLSEDGKTMTMTMQGAPTNANGTLTKVETK